MSYILDALKKSQAEQAGDGVGLRVQQSTTRRTQTLWLAAGLIAVLVFNAGLLLYIFVLDEEPTSVSSAPLIPQEITPSQAEPAPTQVAPAPVDKPTPQPPIERPTPQPPAERIRQVSLFDLPASEQVLYRGFNYSSHIYTDDPKLCAIVIDGQRLGVGDAFKGLTVHAITEAGVIFEETRRGQRRRIEVSIVELWDS